MKIKKELMSYPTVQEAYIAFDNLYNSFVRKFKRKPSSELWLSLIGSGKQAKTSVVCVYTAESQSEYEYYKSFYEQ